MVPDWEREGERERERDLDSDDKKRNTLLTAI